MGFLHSHKFSHEYFKNQDVDFLSRIIWVNEIKFPIPVLMVSGMFFKNAFFILYINNHVIILQLGIPANNSGKMIKCVIEYIFII